PDATTATLVVELKDTSVTSKVANGTNAFDSATLVVELKDTSVTSKVANGTNAFDYVATVKDGNGNAMSGVVVNWSKAPDNDATLSATTSTTDASGVATITLTSTTKAVADVVVTGAVSTLFTASDDATKVSFVPDATTATLVVELKDTSVTSKVANGTNAFDYVATVKDGNGNAMSGVVVNWSKAPDNDATLSATTSTTDASGIATITLTSTTEEVKDIVVKGEVTTPFTSSGTATKVSFTAELELVLSWENGITSATVDEQPTFSVVVRNKNSHTLIPNKTITFTLASNGDGKPSIYPSTVTSGADGSVTQAPAVSDHTPETVTVTGQITGTTITADLSIPFSAGAINANTSTIYADPDVIFANGTSTSKIVYTPKDSYGNPVTSVDASSISSDIIGITDSGITIGSWALVNNHYEAVLTSGTKIGDIKVIPVIDGKDGIARTTSKILTLIAGAVEVSKGEIKAVPNQIVANGTATSRIEFRPRDASGNFIATLDPATISQVITAQDINGPKDTTMSAWSYDSGAGAYVSTLRSGVTIGVINIMPTVNSANAAAIGVTGTLELIDNPRSNINIAIANTDIAIADGVATNAITITLTDDGGTALPNRKVTVTPSNSELSINGTLASVDFTTDADGKVSLTMASTYASWLGSNGFTVTSEGFSAQGQTTFSLYVDQDTSLISLDKNVLYNNGTDKLTATYKPVDKKGRAIPAGLLNVTFSTTDLGSTQVITPNGYVATVSSQSSPSDYKLSATMTNYSHGWQPSPVDYKLQPISGVLLAVLEVTPKLCGTAANGMSNGMPFSYCSQTDGVDYYHSGLGFIVELKEASPLWDKQITLHSSTVDGAIYISSKDGAKQQNCSVPVSVAQSWMNDFGGASTQNLDLSFTSKNLIDTYDAPGFIRPSSGGGGGVGACDVYLNQDLYAPLKPDLQGSGNVLFEAYTTNPKSTTSFKVPLTGQRMDVGKLSSITVNIYAN
ncbi:Ig-like domain-containing protein, partial [Bartonella sp. LJL80]